MHASYCIVLPVWPTISFFGFVDLQGAQVLQVQQRFKKMSATLSLANPIFANYVFYATVLALKCLLMSMLTARHRIQKKVFDSPEDYEHFGGKKAPPGSNADVERVRSAHRNDMENIFPFFIIGLLFVLSNPAPNVAVWLFRIFTAARVTHSIVYLNGVRQPFRGISFFVGMFVNITMCVLILKTTI